MQLNEIRLGNKISLEGKNYTIDAKMMYAIFSGNPDYDISKFEPILLSSEWLLKFGFKENKVEDITYEKEISHCKGFVVSFSTQSYDWFLCDTDVDTNVKYIHQLQNLYFAMTGLEIDFLK